MEVERAPITRLEKEKATNEKRSNALDTLDTKMTALQIALKALKENTLFTTRAVTSSTTGSTWGLSAAAGTPVGTYKFDIKHLATESKLTGSTDIGMGLSSSNIDRSGALPGGTASGITMATLDTAVPPTAGTFTINGKQVTIALTDSLEGVFQKINDATGGNVSASYDAASDTFSLQAASGTITLGAANDTSNFLTIAKLANNGTGTVQSSGRLGTTDANIPLASARLNVGIGADAEGKGSIKVNGVTIDYDIDTDSLTTVLERITSSTAGVTANYDAVADRIVLNNKVTGSTGITVEDASGGLATALGLTSGTTLDLGTNAEFSVNGGASLFSTSNTLTAAAHGITGLSITATTQSAETVNVAADTSNMKSKIDSFLAKFNDVQDYIDQQTRITTTNGKVTTSTLTNNREVQEWSRRLRTMAFSAIGGMTGNVDQLADLGIDFTTGTNKLEIKDSTKLTKALESNSEDLAEFFSTSSTGFVAKMDTFMTSLLGTDAKGGSLDGQKTALSTANTSIDKQIADLERRLQSQKEALQASFIRMESAQSKTNNILAQLSKSFSS